MRRREKEITDKALMDAIIAGARVCRLGLCRDNIPYVVPVNFGHKDGSLYIHSAREGLKMEILKVNNRVCVEMEVDVEVVPADAPCDWTVQYYSIIGFGTAHIVLDPQEKVRGLDIIMEHHRAPSQQPYPPGLIEKVAIIRIDVERMTGKKSGY
ncbi:MAG: pyridoxamine 5'-phosphate oxidase family protein [Thermodesulfobacteriota bacterium]